jgi:uncharacterized protein YcbK (DUF882 family)
VREQLSPNFFRDEFECGCGCGFDTVDVQLLEALEAIRQHFHAPVKVTSGARCQVHNRAVKGSGDSQHLSARAADVVVEGVIASRVADWCEKTWPDTYGIGRYAGWTHIDTRADMARW